MPGKGEGVRPDEWRQDQRFALGVPEMVLPHNTEAEMSVLGAMLLGDVEACEKAAEMLAARDFYRDAHQYFWSAFLSLMEKRVPIDAVTLRDEMIRLGVWEQAGGASYLMALGDSVPSTANVEYYAGIVLEKARLRRLVEAGTYIRGLALNPDVTDEEALTTAHRWVEECRGSEVRLPWKTAGEIADDCLVKIEERRDRGGGYEGIPCGIEEIDKILSGLPIGSHVLAAPPSVGKTSLAASIARNIAKAGGLVAFFSLDDMETKVGNRLISMESAVPLAMIREGKFRNGQWSKVQTAVQAIKNWPLVIDDSPDITMPEIRTRCRRLRRERGHISLVVIDYLQILCDPENMSRRGDTWLIAERCRQVKAMATELACPVLLLSQVTRGEQGEEKLYGGRMIEANAYAVWRLDCPEFWDRRKQVRSSSGLAGDGWMQNEGVPDLAFLVIDKAKDGPTGTVEIAHIPDRCLFTDWKGPR